MTPAELKRLARSIDAEVDARVREGLCGCGCGERLPIPYRGKGRDRHQIPFEEGRKRFVRESHRQRHYKDKLRRLAHAQDAPLVLSLKTVGLGSPTRDRSGDAPGKPRKRQTSSRKGVSIYLPTVQDAERLAEWLDLQREGEHATTELEEARRAVDRALTRRARKAAA